MTSNVNSEPEGLPACVLQAAINDEGVEWFTIAASLPHYQAQAESRAAGSTRLRRLGLPIPIEGEPGIARLWAMWRKIRDGGAVLHGIEIRAGKKRSDKRVIDLHHRGGGAFGCRLGLYRNHPGYAARRTLLLATCRAVDTLAGLAGEQDVLAAVGRMGAPSGLCACCGRMLTDPLSIDMGVGPECAGLMRRAVLEAWKQRRARNGEPAGELPLMQEPAPPRGDDPAGELLAGRRAS